MDSLRAGAVFLDRDGVINRKAPEGDYIGAWEQVQFIEGAVAAVASLNRAGYQVFVVTNQRGIATKKVKLENMLDIHYRIQQEFTRGGAAISQIYYCPHDLPAMCSCRKPQPGMLRRAAREHNLDLAASWMVGDSISDVRAGQNAGCHSVLLASGSANISAGSQASLVAESLEAAVPLMLNRCRGATQLVSAHPVELFRSCRRED